MGLSCKGKSSVAVCHSSSEPHQSAATKTKCNNSINSNSNSNSNNQHLQVFKFKDLEAATNGFSNENLIVKASHGLIFRGVLQDGRVVAVKRPTPGARLWHDEDAFENEMQVLSKLFSQRLVNLLGHSQDGKVKLLVVEHMANGSLHDRLHGTIDRAACLTWPMRVQLALQVAKAVRALHASSPPIIHRNIRSMNVFIDRDWNARVGDFGLARCAHESPVEPPRRSSCTLSSIPEVDAEDGTSPTTFHGLLDTSTDAHSGGQPAHITAKTDVFNFGMLLLEILSGRTPISLNADFKPFSLLDWALPLIRSDNALAILDPRLKPPHLAAAKQIAAIADRCVRPSDGRRPSMDDVVHALASVSKLFPTPVWGELTKLKSRIRTRHEGLFLGSARFIRLPLWTGFVRSRKGKRAVVVGLGKLLARKLRIGGGPSSEYARLPTKPAGRSGGASCRTRSKVCDDVQGVRFAAVPGTGKALLQGVECLNPCLPLQVKHSLSSSNKLPAASRKAPPGPGVLSQPARIPNAGGHRERGAARSRFTSVMHPVHSEGVFK